MSISLKISNPCEQEFTKMPKSANGSYCSYCSKNVIDFSLRSDCEILDILKNSKANICGAFSSDQLNRKLINKQNRSPTHSSFRNFFSGLFLLFSPLLAKGQNRTKTATSVHVETQNCTHDDDIVEDSAKQVLEPIVVVSKQVYKRYDLIMGGLTIIKEDSNKDKGKKKWWMFWKKK